MKKLLVILFLLPLLSIHVSASDIAMPPIPPSAEELLPQEHESFSAGLWQLVTNAISKLHPEFAASLKLCVSLLTASLLMSLLQSFEGRSKALGELAGVLVIAGILLGQTHSMIIMGTSAIQEISRYGALLLPVMTAALASQGGISSSAALYAATALFDNILSSLIAVALVPMVYIYLVVAIVNAAAGDDLMKKLRDLIKWALTWGLKIVLYLFTGYIGLTGIITGTADQTAVKATKLTISGMIPVVGGILSDASETVLVSAAAVKNTAGVAGLLTILAVTIMPFLTIALHYLMLKLTSAVSGIFAPKTMSSLVEDISVAMGLVLAMTGSVCLIQMISLVCFMKGMG